MDVQVSKKQLRECRLTFSRPLDNNAIVQLVFLISKENSCGVQNNRLKKTFEPVHDISNNVAFRHV